jgi:arylsulfatase A-like enzyme
MPNFILITMDTVRPDHLGCYGYTQAKTPNIDRLAGTSTIFSHAITNGSYTKTAFPPILSSTYAGMYGGPFATVASERPMLARVLQSHGYRTAGFTANPLLGAHVGYDEGFDDFKEPVPPPDTRGWLKLKGAQTVLRSPAANALLMSLGADTAPHPVYVQGDIVTNLACSWLESQTGDFFLWVHYMDPHWPYHNPQMLNSGAERARAWQDLHLAWKYRKADPGETFIERLISLYDKAISQMDGYIGQILKSLEVNHLLEDTAILLTADHGEAFYEHNRWQHGAYYDFHEEILRVPLILHLPGAVHQTRVDSPVYLLDLAPTILDFLGVPIDRKMEGKSLLPLLAGVSPEMNQPAIIEMLDLALYCACIRTPQYKYLYDERRPEVRELYDLVQDPKEGTNVFGLYPTIESELESVLQEHLQRVRDTSPRDATGQWKKDDDVVRRLKALGYLD